MSGKIKLCKVGTHSYRFDLIAGNRAVIGSSEEFSSKQAAIHAIEFLREHVEEESRYEIVEESSGKIYFQLADEAGVVVLRSQGSSTVEAAQSAINAAQHAALNARLVEPKPRAAGGSKSVSSEDTIASGSVESIDLASSPCSVREVSEEYGGYVRREELKELLLALLEAERAGAQVCTLSLSDAESPQWKNFLLEVHRDEVSSCVLIIDCLDKLDIAPHDLVGDFVEKCMSIENFRDRMHLLNKGQAWVVRKLDELLPRLQSDSVRARLLQMRDEHNENIAKLASMLN